MKDILDEIRAEAHESLRKSAEDDSRVWVDPNSVETRPDDDEPGTDAAGESKGS